MARAARNPLLPAAYNGNIGQRPAYRTHEAEPRAITGRRIEAIRPTLRTLLFHLFHSLYSRHTVSLSPSFNHSITQQALALQVIGWCYSVQVAEALGEVRQVIEADFVGNFGNISAAFF